jgi:hypothetical protein
LVRDSNIANFPASGSSEPTTFFRGRKMVIATQHKKEQVIAPLFQELGIEPLVLPDFDSDQFGTFAGEVERKQDALSTARLKIQQALTLSGETLGLASEGSFGPHPQMGFVPADKEVLLLMDLENQLEIAVSKISTNTNYAHQQVSSWKELREFAIEVGFPSHALILRTETKLQKGISDWQTLKDTFKEIQLSGAAVQAETDMRAMFNPTRMKVIEKATSLLIHKINSVCPVCSYPGFDIVERKTGLPCLLCQRPTSLTCSVIHGCQHCHHQVENLFTDGERSDPMYCDYCNP